MKTVLRLGLVILATACLSLAPLLTAAREERETDAVDWTARARAAWRETCRTCHTVPDTRFETDRAFLRQITETT